MSSLLAMLKLICQDWQWSEVVDLEEDKQLGPIIGHVKMFLSQCRLAERSHRRAHSLYLNECDRIMQRGWQQVKGVRKIKPCMKGTNHWAVIIALSDNAKHPWVDSFVTLAAYYGLGLYLNERLTTFVQVYGLSPSHLQNVMTAMLSEKDLDTVNDYLRVISALLHHGSNPNERSSSSHLTPWLMSLSVFEDTFKPENQPLFPDLSLTLCQLVELFVAYDADINEILPREIYGRASLQCIMDQRTVLCVVEQQLSRIEQSRQAGIYHLRSRMENLVAFMKDNRAVNVAWLRGKVIRPSRWLLETQVFQPQAWESGDESFIFEDPSYVHRTFNEFASCLNGSGDNTLNESLRNVSRSRHLSRPGSVPMHRSHGFPDLELEDNDIYEDEQSPSNYSESDGPGPSLRSRVRKVARTLIPTTQDILRLGTTDSAISTRRVFAPTRNPETTRTPPQTSVYAPRLDTQEICWHGRIKEKCPLGCLDIFNPPPDGE